MGILMAEEVEKRGIRDKIALKKLIMGSERSSDAQKKKMKELLGVEHVFDIPGLTELYGPGTGLDCIYHEGIHYWADYYILELLDPETLQPVPPGESRRDGDHHPPKRGGSPGSISDERSDQIDSKAMFLRLDPSHA